MLWAVGCCAALTLLQQGSPAGLLSQQPQAHQLQIHPSAVILIAWDLPLSPACLVHMVDERLDVSDGLGL